MAICFIPNFMASFSLIFLCFNGIVSAQLSSTFYSTSCPNALSTIKTAVVSAVNTEARMGASLLRLHFHDCFVQASQLSLFFVLFIFFIYHIDIALHVFLFYEVNIHICILHSMFITKLRKFACVKQFFCYMLFKY